MAPPDAQASVSYGCSGVLSYWLRWLQVLIDWGQSIYHNHAQAVVSYGCSAYKTPLESYLHARLARDPYLILSAWPAWPNATIRATQTSFIAVRAGFK